MRKFFLGLCALAAFTLVSPHIPAYAESLIEPDYDGHSPRATTQWYEYYSPANYQSDMDFITGMRPHHAGALSMSDDYLASTKKSSQRLQSLAKGIIRNQTFEISMLDAVEDLIEKISFNGDAPAFYQVATKYLAMEQRFMRAPTPPIQTALYGSDQVSAEDVRFAKAMIVHHEGALMMCDDYLDNPATNNGYVERMCLDVLRDQAQEIQLMHNIIAQYPGNPNDIIIDPSMIHGMDDMMHHMDMSSVQNMGSTQSSITKYEMQHDTHHGHH